VDVQVFDINYGLFIWAVVAGLAVWVAPAVLGTYLAYRRRRNPILGFFAGFLLSWIGIILVLLLMPPRQKPPAPPAAADPSGEPRRPA
jgi:hypothetical protein